MERSKLYLLHIALNSIAILCLLSGITVALFRDKIGKEWYTYHKHLQLTGLTLLAISVLLALWLRANSDKPSRHITHGIVGVLLLGLLFVQVWWGLNMSSHDSFLLVHRILASSIVVLGSYQVYLGVQAYRNDDAV
jgi:hypothetical protein